METGKSGYFDLVGSNSTFVLRVNWSETYEIIANKSVVKIDSVQIKSTGWYGFTYYPDGLIKINGETAIAMNSGSGAHSVRTNKLDEWYTILEDGATATGSVEVLHDTDGSKTVSIEATGNRYTGCRFYTVSGGTEGGNGWYVDGSEVVTLITIPRASTIGATDANIGSVSMIAVNRKSITYTHTISYEFGSLSGYITSDGRISETEQKMTATSIAFIVPESFYEQIPDAMYGVCILTCKTYSEDIQIGDEQTAQFYVRSAQSVSAPIVSGTVVDSNKATKILTGDDTKLVRFHSNALCTISAYAQNSATIAHKRIGGVSISGDTYTISGIETAEVVFSAVDSRGYETTVPVGFELVPYIHLTNNPSGKRMDAVSGNAEMTVKGNYYNGSFGSQSNSLAVWYKVIKVTDTGEEHGEDIEAQVALNGNSYSLDVNLIDLDYRYEYRIEVTAQDALEKITNSFRIMPGEPSYYWNKRKFCFLVPVVLSEKNYGDALPDGIQKGQTFFLKNSDGSYSLKIYNGTKWE